MSYNSKHSYYNDSIPDNGTYRISAFPVFTASSGGEASLLPGRSYTAKLVINDSVVKTISSGLPDPEYSSSGYNFRLNPIVYDLARTHSNISKNLRIVIKVNGINSGSPATNFSEYGDFYTDPYNVSIMAKTSYIVSFNNNVKTSDPYTSSVSNMPSSQTKWYNENLTLSSTKPTRTGYTFKGWNTNKDSTTASVQPGAIYSGNAAVTYYAIWQINTHTITYNANGGSGGPSSITKNYGQAQTISSIKPIRMNYDFKGWSLSQNGDVQYTEGQTISDYANHTLYAVWKYRTDLPTISNIILEHANQEGNNDEYGSSLNISFTVYATRKIKSISISANIPNINDININYGSSENKYTENYNNTIFIDKILPTNNYNISIIVIDHDNGLTKITQTLQKTSIMPIDILNEGKGIAFGKVAQDDGYADFQFIPRFYLDRDDGTYVSPQYIVNGLARTPLEILPNDSDLYGDGLRIGINGLFIAGSGESSSNFWNSIKDTISPGQETTYVTSDNDVYILTNAQNLPNDNTCIYTFRFADNGSLYCGDDSKSFHCDIHAFNSAVHGQMSANSGGDFGLYSTTHSKWIIVDNTDGTVQLNGNKFNVNTSGETAVGKSYKIPKNGTAGYGLCNSDGTSIIRDHNNNNVSVDATGGTLFLGYQDTTDLNILNGKIEIDNSGGMQFSSSSVEGTYIEPYRIFIGNTNNTNSANLQIRNSAHVATFMINSGGSMGVWSSTLDRWSWVHYPSNGNLGLNGNTVTIDTSGNITSNGSISNNYGRIYQMTKGTVNITPSGANTPTGKAVPFSKAFNSAPTVYTTPVTSAPGTTIRGTGVSGITNRECVIYITRTNTTATGVNWVAFW